MGLNQDEVVDRVKELGGDLSLKAYSNYELGKREPKLGIAQYIMAVLADGYERTRDPSTRPSADGPDLTTEIEVEEVAQGFLGKPLLKPAELTALIFANTRSKGSSLQRTHIRVNTNPLAS